MSNKKNSRQEDDWYEEKAGGNPADWYEEKAGPGRDEWYREKMGLPPRKSRLFLWLFALGFGVLVGGGLIGLFILTRPAPAPTLGIAKTLPTATPDTLATATVAVRATATAEVVNYLANLDNYYKASNAALAAGNFKEAITSFEQVRDLQRQANRNDYDVTLPLFKAYVGNGGQLWQPGRSFEDFKRGLYCYTEANKLDSKNITIENLVRQGDRYYNGKTAYDIRDWTTAVSGFAELYAVNSDFLDGTQLYYNALTQEADGLFKAKRVTEAYRNSVIATRLKNIADKRYAQLQVDTFKKEFDRLGVAPPTV